MRAPLALAALAMTAAALPLLAQAPAAAADTCLGKVPTVVDLDGGPVAGTAGDDVILTAGDVTVAAGDGNDTVCFDEGTVFAGPGQDAVFVAGAIDQEFLDIRDAEDLDVTVGANGGFVQLVDIGDGTGKVDVSGGAALTLVGDTSVLVHLGEDRLALDRGEYTLVGNPGIFAIARRVTLVGDDQVNNLSVNQFACKIMIQGRGGHDRLTVAGSDGDLPFPEDCGDHPNRVYGQRGNDVLQGRGGRDILVGGQGRDKAFGGFGTDTCQAEIEKNCER